MTASRAAVAPASRASSRLAGREGIARALGAVRRGTARAGVPLSRQETRRAGNLHDAAYERLRNALMDGLLVPGQTFTLRSVAAVFGTSPIPVRDALKRLVAENALEMLPNRSVVLPVMTRERFLEILDIRLSLESLLAARAAPRITPEAIEAMAADHAAMCAAAARGRTAEYLASNRRFHFRLYAAAETVVMQAVVETMWMQIGPHLNQIFAGRKRVLDAVDHHHSALLRALRRRDARAAARAVRDDLSDAAAAILAADQFERRP